MAKYHSAIPTKKGRRFADCMHALTCSHAQAGLLRLAYLQSLTILSVADGVLYSYLRMYVLTTQLCYIVVIFF